MARRRLTLKKIDNSSSRQITFSKRREGILKKASELSELCDTDVGLLMFSPSGRLTSYAHRGSVEDVFLRYINHPEDFTGPVDPDQFLYQSLKHLKFEAEMLDKIGSLEALERKLLELNRKKYEAEEKMRSYNPDMTEILTIPEANLHQQFVIDGLRRIEKLKKAKLLEKEASSSKPNDVEIPVVEVKDSDLTTEESINSQKNKTQTGDDNPKEDAQVPAGPHLSISYLKTQKNWSLEPAEDRASSEGTYLRVVSLEEKHSTLVDTDFDPSEKKKSKTL